MAENHICCVFNIAPHYRMPIFSLMDECLSVDFYFGDKVDTDLKIGDVYNLKGYKKTVTNVKVFFNLLWWQKDVLPLVFNKNYKYFILTGDSNLLSTWLVLFFSRILGKRTYLWTHGLQTEPSWKGKLIIYPFYWMANFYLLYGEYAMKVMLELGFPKNKMTCIYNSLDYNNQSLIRKNLGKTSVYTKYFLNNLPTLIYIGRIQKVKRINQIFESLKLLEKRNLYCNIMFIGENTDNINVERLYIESNLQSKFWYYGPCYDECKIAEFLYNAAVCVSPGNIGLTAIHSLTYGTPCITHNNFQNQMPEFEVIVPGKTGDFFNENDIQGLSEITEKWLFMDNSEREILRYNCNMVVDQKYNPKSQIEIIRNLLNS